MKTQFHIREWCGSQDWNWSGPYPSFEAANERAHARMKGDHTITSIEIFGPCGHQGGWSIGLTGPRIGTWYPKNETHLKTVWRKGSDS